MEGVGARFCRSSTRYGPTTVFTGPVRRWKKKWIHVSSNKNNNQTTTAVANGAVNGSNGSHLLLLKWRPITASQNNSSDEKDGDSNKDEVVPIEEPRKRNFKFIPIAVLEDQKYETTEQDEDEAKPMEADANTREPTCQADGCDEKPDINDLPMEENQDPQDTQDKPPERQDLNESTLGLSLGLTSHDENDSDSKRDKTKGG